MAMVNANSKNRITIRLAETKDWQAIRDVMLEMLADAPHAFGDTLAEAESREMQEWQQLVEHLTNTPYGCAYIVAQDHQGECGFVLGDTRLSRLPPGAVIAARLWVAPRQRERGLGRKLMDAVTRWAKEQSMDQIFVGIKDTNLGVMKFFEHLGYHDTGIRRQLSDDSPRQLILMARKLEQLKRTAGG
jgi:L-amino acid N-acyltransferase YncA